MLDSLFSRFKWYRKLIGGVWFLISYELPEENLYSTGWVREGKQVLVFNLHTNLVRQETY